MPSTSSHPLGADSGLVLASLSVPSRQTVFKAACESRSNSDAKANCTTAHQEGSFCQASLRFIVACVSLCLALPFSIPSFFAPDFSRAASLLTGVLRLGDHGFVLGQGRM